MVEVSAAPVRKTGAKTKERLERARQVWRLLRHTGPEGMSIYGLVSATDFSVAEVLESIQDVRDKGVDVWALSDSTGVRFALEPKVAHDAPL